MINYLSRQKLRNVDEIPVFVGQYFFYQVGQTVASRALVSQETYLHIAEDFNKPLD